MKEKVEVNDQNSDQVLKNVKGKENVKKVLDIIKSKGLNATLYAHPHTAVTSLKIHLDLYGGSAGQVMKCLCMVSKNRPLAVIASGEVRIDVNKLSKVSHMKEVMMASKDELIELFGREPGGVDPLTIPESIPVFADQKLFEKKWVVGSAGSPHVGLKINPNDLLKIRKVIIADLAKNV